MRQAVFVTKKLVNTSVSKFLAFQACVKLRYTQPDQNASSRQEIAPLTLKKAW